VDLDDEQHAAKPAFFSGENIRGALPLPSSPTQLSPSRA
jgi:hypothetical protein